MICARIGHVVQDRPLRHLRERQRAVCHRHRRQYLQRQHRQPVKRRRGLPPQAQAVAGTGRVPPEVRGLPRAAPKAGGVGGQDEGLPCGVQVRQRPDPQTRRRDGLTDQAQNTRTVNREESLPKTALNDPTQFEQVDETCRLGRVVLYSKSLGMAGVS